MKYFIAVSNALIPELERSMLSCGFEKKLDGVFYKKDKTKTNYIMYLVMIPGM